MAVGTSSLIMAMTAASGTLGYGLQGNVDYATGIIISIAAVLSGMLSARLANRVPDVILNRIAGSVFAVLGIVMMILK
jgi:hypothetical protein